MQGSVGLAGQLHHQEECNPYHTISSGNFPFILMTYVPQNKLAQWRKENAPGRCPILDRVTDDLVVDHDHLNGEIRAVISREANTMLGKIENIHRSICRGNPKDLPQVLLNIAEYLKAPASGILHPVGIKQLTSRFKRNLNKEEQEFALQKMGAKKSEISCCKNVNDRSALYRTLVKTIYTK